MLLGLPVLAPILREEFDLTLTEVGIVLASVWVGPIFTLLPWGLAADRFGERLALAVGLTAMGLLVAAAAAVDDFYAFVGLMGLASAAGSSVNSASGRAVMHWFGAEERGFALGLRQASLPLGGALAAVTLPAIVGASSLDGALLFLAVLCLVAALVSALVVRDRPATDSVEEPEPWTLRDRRLWLLSSGSSLFLVAQIALTGFLVLFLHDARGLSTGEAAAVLAVAQVIAIVLADRCRPLVGPRPRAHPPLAARRARDLRHARALRGSRHRPARDSRPDARRGDGVLDDVERPLVHGRRGTGRALAKRRRDRLSADDAVDRRLRCAAPLFAALVDASSWRTGFAVFAAAPLAGWWVLGQLAPED